MKKILYFSLISGLTLLLCGCASHFGSIAAGSAQGTASTVQAKGLGEVNDLQALQSLQTDPGPHNGILAVRSFYFAFDRYDVSPQDLPIIRAHAQYLLQHPEKHVVIEGNTDIRGSREYNIALGQRRAGAVQNILRMQGVQASQIRAVSYGAEKPIAYGNTETAYSLNRRDDLRYED
ncbi:MAG: peptidoglycan-associated lipoprotein Pal [Gammaproteobacteria bacterium]|jgi:peptidoglycan-associated lipoprotein